MQRNRMVQVNVSFDVIAMLLGADYETGGIVKNDQGLPADSEVVGLEFHPEPYRRFVSIFLAHDSFEPVHEIGKPPIVSVGYSVDYTPIDLLKEFANPVSRDRDGYLGEMDDLRDRAQEWLKENGHVG